MNSNNKEIINEEIAYQKKDNTINFKINNDLYKYDLKNYILTKKDAEKELVIKFKEKVIIIYAINEGISLNYPMLKSKIKEQNNTINISYTLDEEVKLNNTIIIEF